MTAIEPSSKYRELTVTVVERVKIDLSVSSAKVQPLIALIMATNIIPPGAFAQVAPQTHVTVSFRRLTIYTARLPT